MNKKIITRWYEENMVTLHLIARNLCLRYGLPLNEIDDYIEDVFVEICSESIGPLENYDDNPIPFLAKILERNLIDELRKKKEQKVEIDEYACDQNGFDNYISISASNSRYNDMMDTLEKHLSSTVFETFKLHVEGYSYSEIVRKLGLKSNETARSRVHRARKLAKEII